VNAVKTSNLKLKGKHKFEGKGHGGPILNGCYVLNVWGHRMKSFGSRQGRDSDLLSRMRRLWVA
jgi:hypothetical protein